jgi:prepilin-type N-terminal cleavage/methylation domain-containing protein
MNITPGTRSRRRIGTGHARERGFTLLELAIVVAVTAIMAAMAIPNLLNARTATNESATISNLRTLHSVNEQYSVRFRRYASSLSDLQAAGYADGNLTAGAKQGYTFTYTGTPYTFACTADPSDPGQSGRRYFFLDHTGVVRFSSTGTATSADQPVDS